MPPTTFDTFWVDLDGNAWGLRVEPDGIKLYTQSSNGWMEVTQIPQEALDDIEEELDEINRIR